ncbi:MAG: hypothetical protein NUV46_02640 [Nanoarchaeota archaeon]|nr:hypothetical protein [Nanoarchaeota archaeon]
MNESDDFLVNGKIKQAREVNRAFYSPEGIFHNKGIDELSLKERRNLVSMFYSDIKGVPINKVPSNQISAISYNVYYKALSIVDKCGVDEYERRILDDINKIKTSSDESEKYSLIERLSLELEDKPCTGVSIKLNNCISEVFPYDEKDTPF